MPTPRERLVINAVGLLLCGMQAKRPGLCKIGYGSRRKLRVFSDAASFGLPAFSHAAGCLGGDASALGTETSGKLQRAGRLPERLLCVAFVPEFTLQTTGRIARPGHYFIFPCTTDVHGGIVPQWTLTAGMIVSKTTGGL